MALRSPSKSVCHREDENATEWFQNWKGRDCGAVGRAGVSETIGTWFESNRHRINLHLRGPEKVLVDTLVSNFLRQLKYLNKKQ